MSLFQDLRSLIINKDIIKQLIDTPLNNDASNLLTFWFKCSREKQTKLFIGGLIFGLSIYILAPSIRLLFRGSYDYENDKGMLSKRPDKYTTGLINLRNDCFANSSLQAYLALAGFTDYLNKFITSFDELKAFISANGISEDILKADMNDKSSRKSKQNGFEIPLHIAMATIVKKLQTTQMSSHTISVWTFLHCLEKIFNAKISKSQHDAQELSQLINETLENENIRIAKSLKSIKSAISDNHILLEQMEAVEVPEFPLKGLILSQMRCLECQALSKPHFAPFLMITLHPPEELQTNIDTLLEENEKETISGYQCLKCRLLKIIANEDFMKEKGILKNDDKENELIAKLREYNGEEALCINEDLAEDLEKYIKEYNKGGLDISKITSTVMRSALILKPPKIFGLHLSRSSFNGYEIVRNPCNVSFKDSLTLSIGKKYSDKIKQLQAAAQEELSEDIPNIESKVLTTDSDDMEDEDVQREDIDQKGNEDEEEEEEDDDDTDVDTDLEDDDTDSSSFTSTESMQNNNPNDSSDKGSRSTDVTSEMSVLKTSETINKTPISDEQTGKLVEQFKQFKFNDNDIYKYRLKAVIKHQGSHTQGHYECYKKKPLYVKNKDGTIFKLSPEILDNVVTTESTESSTVDATSLSSLKPNEPSSLKRRLSLLNKKRSETNNEDLNSASNAEDPPLLKNLQEEDEDSSGFRKKFSTMMGRRPSLYQADPAHANIQEILSSGLTTPAEVLVNDLESDYFSKPMESDKAQSQNDDHTVRMKKIPSLIKHPFWKISDANVMEVSKASVLCETSSVYMLYYERVDRKQIKGSHRV
ncbi:uncharacterized protein PRCAT00003997001 [Priceomyces carsonii]|uniref:uncharacterized protein n=1 Tax=Priceomyces carsonii TaxID=28549 RepID=UPI002EDB70CE|nr:unnamed protein product [Priceomyces carsonii]